MKTINSTSLWKLCCVLVPFVIFSMNMVLAPSPSKAFSDTCSPCDSQYNACLASCDPQDSECVTYCGSPQYGGCIFDCLSGTYGPVGAPERACRRQAMSVYDSCMDGTSGECINSDGTVNAGCCYNVQVQQYFGCRYP